MPRARPLAAGAGAAVVRSLNLRQMIEMMADLPFCGTVGSRPAGRVRRGPRPAATTWKPLHGDTWRSRLREAGRSARDSDSQDQ